jgi:hypothetical protein
MGNGASPNGLSYRAHSRLYLHYRAEPSNERLVFGGVGSIGRCNTGVKSLRWGFECQSLTRPFVERTSHFVEMSLRMHRQVGPLREVLPEQTIGVFIGRTSQRDPRTGVQEADLWVARFHD